MATTTNFGWETPDDTDLVKDGAAAIRTVANSIDTSLVDLKGGTTGQVLSKASNTDLDFTWVTDSGDIAGVTAGTGISGGGSSGTVTITNSMATAIDAKGDLIAGTGADTFDRLAVGTNGQALIADSTTTTGLKWGTVTPSYDYTNFTPTLTQNGAVAKTVTVGRYVQIGKMVHCEVKLSITGTGNANQPITLGRPVNNAQNGSLYGVAKLYDSSAGLVYKGLLTSYGDVTPTENTTSGVWGQLSFTAALASGDTIEYFMIYEAA